MNAAHDLGIDQIQGGVEWLRGVRETIEKLVYNRNRCLAITNDRMREICLTSWNAQVLYETARLANEITSIAGDEVSQQFIEAMRACFGVESPPEEIPERYKY